MRYFAPSGLFAQAGATWVAQEVDLAPSATFARDEDDFILFDAALGYRLPKRRGVVSLEVRNLLDERFLYQDLDVLTAQQVNPRFIPDRMILVRVTLSF